MGSWLWHALVFGGGSLLIPTAILLVCLRWARPAFADDYPPDIQSRMPPFTRTERRLSWVLGPAFILTLLAAVLWTTWSWLDADPARGLLSAYGMALGTAALFCLVDLVLVDWLIICRWRPSWVIIPGTADAAGWGDYGFHLRAQFSGKGLLALFGLPAAVAAVAVLLPR
ncbi:hypothetical protein MCHIJ_48620 [Mycolicibacterium chitae]|uniref:Uncharacterized protein n=2 Tax=Mycolicibacterium chitae TaxID=1792 RepID=A0A448I9E0_MYCCI|nr:hypothetical protein [Mycolicibacterium chitae]MCV7104508.1 hypothetical protein [Mycolicibacterium chitae]BBZ05425.1 hypothetical protein MCHIJ_48620 [Mycolicibacterium chitae]VEG49042.1 Uncharacterised protein [Mycolicibacterium chitae]